MTKGPKTNRVGAHEQPRQQPPSTVLRRARARNWIHMVMITARQTKLPRHIRFYSIIKSLGEIVELTCFFI